MFYSGQARNGSAPAASSRIVATVIRRLRSASPSDAFSLRLGRTKPADGFMNESRRVKQ